MNKRAPLAAVALSLVLVALGYVIGGLAVESIEAHLEMKTEQATEGVYNE
jgi:hypothetical protein